tara:strand:- start:1400 stop:2077 length:678 start_codon:yes stop_codon:yes gene_type:complete
MGDNFQFLEIIFFAMIAVFIVLRLRNMLGRRTGNEHNSHRDFAKRENDAATSSDVGNVVNINDRAEVNLNYFDEGEKKDFLYKILESDPSFNEKDFIKGAKTAYDMILSSFSSGDTDTLRMLLDDDVYTDFQSAINDREVNNETLETTLVSIKSADILDTSVKGRLVEITVKFDSETINVTRDSDGNVLSGDPTTIKQVKDLWTFARDAQSRDLNWKLVATRSDH